MARQTRIVLVVFVLFTAMGLYLLTLPGLTAAAAPMSAPAAGGSQRYVNGATGVDGTGDCTNTAGNPICKTIGYALSVSIAGSAIMSDTINIFPGTYNQGSTLVISKYIILQGTSSNGADARIDGTGFTGSVIHAEAPRLTINNLTIQKGNAGSGVGGGINVSGTSAVTIRNSFILSNTASAGGGIYTNDAGSLFIVRSQFADNSATGNGGALFGGPGAGMVITASAVISNVSTDGAGIYNQGALTVINSTIGDNGTIATGNGGGIFTTGTGTSVSLNNATIAFNTVNGNGGGIFNSGSTVTLQNTILAGNTGASPTIDCFGTFTSAGYNLVGTGNSCAGLPGVNDLSTSNPLLGPLTSNGSYTEYHMPQSTPSASPAINAGNPAGCTDGQGNLLTNDQRNAVRPQGGRCDIGSVEVGNAPSLSNINPSSVIAATGGFSMTLTGSNFPTTNPRVLWIVNGVTVTTFFTPSMSSFGSPTQIVLNVPGNLIVLPGTANVAVQNPSGVGNISPALPFMILPNASQTLLYLPVSFR